MNNKTIIVYFSYTGHTKWIAEKIREKLNCDILEIKTKVPYSTDYETVVNDEQNSERSNFLPKLQDINVDFKKYDRIILGTPVWWYRPAPAIRSFLHDFDLSNKIIVPFATNAGWLGKTFRELKEICSDSLMEKEMNIVFESYGDRLKTNEEELNNWINTL